MLFKLNKALEAINARIDINQIDPLFSEYKLFYKDMIIGNGWKLESESDIIGFMGWAMPALRGELCWTKNSQSINDDQFEDCLKLFQFSISDKYYWYSPPVNNNLAGFSCRRLNDPIYLLNDINFYINNNFDSLIFQSENYNWEWPE